MENKKATIANKQTKQKQKSTNKQKPSELSLSLILGCTIEHDRFSALEKLKRDRETHRERNREREKQ